MVRWTRPTDQAQSGDNGLIRTAKESNHNCTTTCEECVVTMDRHSQPKNQTTTQVRYPSTGSAAPPEPRAPYRAGSSHRIQPPRRSPGPPDAVSQRVKPQRRCGIQALDRGPHPPEPRAPSRAGSSHRIQPPRRSPGPPPPGGGPESRTNSSCPLRPPPGRQCLGYPIKPQA